MRHKCARAMICAILVILCALSAQAITLDFDGAEYTATTAETITVAWSASVLSVDGADKACTCEYELRVYHAERKTYTDGGKTTALTRAFKLPKTGHYVVEVRGCQGSGDGRLCSDWASSTNEDSAQVDGVKRRWRIYGRPASAGEITITK
jgi:hypothetical protein